MKPSNDTKLDTEPIEGSDKANYGIEPEDNLDEESENETITDDNSNDLEIDSEKPFGEEFDSEDVVNREEEVTDPFPDINKQEPFKDEIEVQNQKGLLEIDDINDFLSLDEDTRKKSSFYDEFKVADLPTESVHDYNRKKFKDFLELPKITGNNRDAPDSNVIPSTYLNKRQKKVHIADEPGMKEVAHSKTSVIVNRDGTGEIESIEVYCRCGEKTMIEFDYSGETLKHEDLTEPVVDSVEENALSVEDQLKNIDEDIEDSGIYDDLLEEDNQKGEEVEPINIPEESIDQIDDLDFDDDLIIESED